MDRAVLKKTRADDDAEVLHCDNAPKDLFFEACITGGSADVRQLLDHYGADPAWVTCERSPLVLPSVAWWSVYEIPVEEDDESAPLIRHICARPSKDSETAKILNLLFQACPERIEICQEEALKCLVLTAARGSYDALLCLRFLSKDVRLGYYAALGPAIGMQCP